MTVASAATVDGGSLPDGLADDLGAAALMLARRLHAGGTLWCAAPSWPHHAQHVAVEFVHPVVVGTRALPAVSLPSHDLVATARASVRDGDVLLVIGPGSDRVVRDLVRRAPVWGAKALWIGAGERPEAGAADHVLWLPDDETAAYDGRFILLYHLLWELAHVCLEHTGALSREPECDGPVCTTCSDEGRLAEVVESHGTAARVRTAAGVEDVDLSLVGAVSRHSLLVVHAGMAIAVLPDSPPLGTP